MGAKALGPANPLAGNGDVALTTLLHIPAVFHHIPSILHHIPAIFQPYSTMFQPYSSHIPPYPSHIPAIFHHIPPYSSRIPQHSAIFGPVNPAGSGVVALTTLLHWAPPSPHTLRQVLFFAVTPTFDSATPKRTYHPNVQVCDLGTFVTTALFLLLPYLTRQQ